MYLTLHFIIIFSPFIIFYADASRLDFFFAVNKDAQKHDKEFWENCPGPIGIVAQWFTDLHQLRSQFLPAQIGKTPPFETASHQLKELTVSSVAYKYSYSAGFLLELYYTSVRTISLQTKCR